MSEESMLILTMLGDGKITAEQADSLLRAVRETAAPTPPTPPTPPVPPTPPSPDPATLADMQRKLAELQGKLGDVQGKIGAAQAARAAGQAASFAGKVIDHIPRLDVDVNKIVDDAMRGLNSFKSDAVRSARLAARQAAQEARRAARQSRQDWNRKGFKIDFNFDFGESGDSGRPENQTGLPEAQENSDSTLTWTGAETLILANNYGSIQVVGQDNLEGAAQITLEKTAWAGTESEARVLLQQIFLTNRVENGKYRVEVVAPQDARDKVTVDYVARVPQHIAVEIETKHGDIAAEGVSSVLSARSESGAIRAANPWGDTAGEAHIRSHSGDVALEQWVAPKSGLSVETTSGDIRAEGLRVGLEVSLSTRSGDLTVSGLHTNAGASLHSASGDVSVAGGAVATRLAAQTQSGGLRVTGLRAPQIHVETVSGDAELHATDGTLTVKTVSGDVEAEGIQSPAVSLGTVSGDAEFAFAAPFTGSFSGTTVSGDLCLALWTNSDARVEMNTTNGDLSCSLPLTDPSPENERHLSGKLGDGTGSIRLQSVSGDLHIQAQK